MFWGSDFGGGPGGRGGMFSDTFKFAYSDWFLQIAQKKKDLLACEESHHAPVSWEDCQFHQITKHTEDLQQELLVGDRHVNTVGNIVDFFHLYLFICG